MIFVYILGGILLLVALILLIKVSFFAAFCDGKPYVAVKVGFLTFPIVTGEETPEVPTSHTGEKPKAKKKKPKKKKKEKKPARPAEPPTFAELAGLVKTLLGDLTAGIKKHFRLEELRVRVLVATDDAAKTAIRYGEVNALLAPVQAFCDCVPKRRKNEKKVLVQSECDFLAESMELDARFGFSFRVGGALAIALRSCKDALALIDALKRRKAAKEKDHEEEQKGTEE